MTLPPATDCPPNRFRRRTYVGRRTHLSAVAIAAVGIGAAIVTPPAGAEAKASPADKARATRALFASVTPTTPGCTVAVARNGRVVFRGAFGSADLARKRPMTSRTVVDIGSTSKQFTATAILLLAQRGTIQLDAAVSTYVPSLPSWANDVTVRQMIHHQSGIPDYIELLLRRGLKYTERTTDADALKALSEATLTFAPGTKWEYSNSNYFLLGQVVLSVTGANLDSFLRAEVFTPLRLDARMAPAARIAGKATSYERVGQKWVVADSPWEQLGDGGIQTTPSQLVRWATQYWAPTIGGPDLLRARTDRAVSTGVPGERYGAGIFEKRDPKRGRILQHSGGWGGFVTFFEMQPAKRLAVAGTCTSAAVIQRSSLGLETGEKILAIWSR